MTTREVSQSCMKQRATSTKFIMLFVCGSSITPHFHDNLQKDPLVVLCSELSLEKCYLEGLLHQFRSEADRSANLCMIYYSI